MQNQFSSLLDIYRGAALGNPTEYSMDFWGDIPSNFQNLRKTIEQRQKQIDFASYDHNVEKFRKIVKKNHRKYGTFTRSVQNSLDLVNHGFLDVGHQPLLLGGSLFLISKVAYSDWLGKILNIGTLFYIGDHDSIQNELTITRFPQANSPTGLTVSHPDWNVPEGTPMHQVPVPSEDWLHDIKAKIQENIRALMKESKVRLDLRQLLLERFLNWYDLVYETALRSNNFSYWTQLIWTQLFNLRNNLSVFLTPSSDLEYREIVLPAFEFLITEKNRELYIETLNTYHTRITSLKLIPGLTHREDSYVPFFLECLKCPTKTRVQLNIISPGVLSGKCRVCTEDYSFSYNEKKPDLSEVKHSLTPRSDSRAIVNNYSFPLLAHVGGPGETSYYSAVIPTMRRLGINPPVLLRSNRFYYSTPWGEKSASDINTPMLTPEVYNVFRDYNQASEPSIVRSALESMRINLENQHKKILAFLTEKQETLKSMPQNRKLRKEILNLELMLSHNYGRFAPRKKAQEVSWNWLDLALFTGINGISNIFQRQLKQEAYPGFTWYITPGKFT